MHESEEHDFFSGGGGGYRYNMVDQVALTTIGIDVGSATFHFMFARIHLQRGAGGQGRFGVVKREILWRSPIHFTPYQGSRIDASEVSLEIELGHKAARIPPEHIDSGAIILTGEALRAENARALADAIATEAGSFVSVSAGHHLEAMLAAFGSGAVGVAREHGQCLLHVDIGGGTTKLAIIDPTGVRQTAAINGGGRTVVLDKERRVSRMSAGARPLGRHAGIKLASGATLPEASSKALAEALADAIVGIVNHATRGTAEPSLRLTSPLDRHWQPNAISFSGGVSEYLYDREHRDFGDLGPAIAGALRARLRDGRIGLPLIDPGEGIRATVIGAAQSSMQVSGNTVAISENEILPIHNVPVVHPHFNNVELDAAEIADAIREETSLYGFGAHTPFALSISWEGSASYDRLHELAHGISEGLGTEHDVVAMVLLDQDIAATLGRILIEEFPRTGGLVCLDGLHLSPLDYVDVGKRVEPSGVFPVVIKSLLFDVQHHHEHLHLDDHEGHR